MPAFSQFISDGISGVQRMSNQNILEMKNLQLIICPQNSTTEVNLKVYLQCNNLLPYIWQRMQKINALVQIAGD